MADEVKKPYWEKPDPMRRGLTRGERRRAIAEKLDKLTHLDRARLGAKRWNVWAWSMRHELRHLQDRMPDSCHSLNFNEGPTEHVDVETIAPIRTEINTTFNRFLFPVDVSFSNCQFLCAASFSEAHFFGLALFRDTLFAKGAAFIRTSFRTIGIFSESRFRELTSWHGSSFKGGINFERATFEGVTYFNGSVFGPDVSFELVTFEQRVEFDDLMFSHNLKFDRTKFIDKVFFENVSFVEGVNFESARFKSSAFFSDVVFGGETLFVGCLFDGWTLFDNAVFRTMATFENVTFSVSASFRGSKFEGDSYFDRSKFGSSLDMDHVIFEGLPDLDAVEFAYPPNLSYVTAPCPKRTQAVNSWSTGYFPDKKRIVDADGARKYRRLKQLSAAGHNHWMEAYFFRQELLAKRGHETKGWWEETAISLFEFASHCGMSVGRPFVGLFATCALAMTYFATFVDWAAKPVEGVSGKLGFLVEYTVLNSLPFIGFGASFKSTAFEVLYGGPKEISHWVTGMAMVQNLASFAWLFLLFLGIRNYFRLK